MIRTFVDTGVLIILGRSDVRDQLRAMPFMYDPQRRFVVSPFVELELLPTPIRTGRADQFKFLPRVSSESRVDRRFEENS